MTVPPSSVHAEVRARMAVVFPAPAGAIASWSAAPEVAIERTSAVWPALSGVWLAACSSSVTVTACSVAACRPARPAAATSRCSAARISRLVNRAAPATSYMLAPSERRSTAGSVSPSPSGVSRTDASRAASTTRSSTVSTSRGGECGGADLPVGLGPHVPHLPGGAARLHLRQHPCGGLLYPRGVDPDRRGLAPGRQCSPDHPGDPVGPAQDVLGLGAPGGALLVQGARFVLGLAGLEGRLLGQLDGLDDGRGAAVVALEGLGELGPSGLDGLTSL